MISLKNLHVGLFAATAAFAMTAIAEGNFSIPHLKKGIWAIRHTQELEGQPAKSAPERLTTWCFDPGAKIREDIMSMQNNGCSIKLEPAPTDSDSVYSASCEAGPGRSQEIQLSIKSTNPSQFKVTNTSKEGKNVLEGHWVRNCS